MSKLLQFSKHALAGDEQQVLLLVGHPCLSSASKINLKSRLSIC